MKKYISKKIAFTLIEVLVSITIFWIMSISIIWIYITSSDVTLKSDINRMMQENLKNVSNTIAEDIRKNWIDWVSININPSDTCDIVMWANNYKNGDKLCITWWNTYYLAKEDTVTSWSFNRVSNSECSLITDNCIIVKLWEPLTNSYVSVKELSFYLSKDNIPKVTMNIVIQPSIKKWVKPNLIKESKIIFQTTISERPF